MHYIIEQDSSILNKDVHNRSSDSFLDFTIEMRYVFRITRIYSTLIKNRTLIQSSHNRNLSKCSVYTT